MIKLLGNHFFLNNMIKIKHKNILINDFEEKNINQKFINSLNNKRLNKFLSTGKRKQFKKDAISYFQFMKKNKHIYLAVFDTKKKEFVGTITFRDQDKKRFYIGYMVCNIKYLGNEFFFNSVKLAINYVSKKYKIKEIIAGTDKKNLPSSFFLIKLGFKVIYKNDKSFKFLKTIK